MVRPECLRSERVKTSAPRRRASFCLWLGVFLIGTAPGESAAQVTSRIVAVTGAPAPGASDGAVVYSFSQDNFFIDGHGRVSFGAILNDLEDYGYFGEDENGAVQLVRHGAAAPGTSGTFDFLSSCFPCRSRLYVDRDGNKALFAEAASSDGLGRSGVWTFDAGAPQGIAAEGNAAAGTQTRFRSVAAPLAGGGRAFFRGVLDPEDTVEEITESNNDAAWIGESGTHSLVLREDEPMPGEAEDVSVTGVIPVALGSRLALKINGCTPGCFTRPAGLYKSQLTSPGVFTRIADGDVGLIGAGTMNASGQVAFHAQTSTGHAILVESASGLRTAWKEGLVAPDESGGLDGLFQKAPFSMSLFDSGEIVVLAETSDRRTGIWRETDTGLIRVVQTGDSAPGAGTGRTFSNIWEISVNNVGHIAFRGRAGTVDGWWFADPTGNIFPLVLEDDEIEIASDDVRRVRAASGPHTDAAVISRSGIASNGVDGGSAYINDRSEIVLNVSFAASNALMVFTLSAPFVVNSISNENDREAGDGQCETSGPPVNGQPECTLQAALQEANANSGRDRIVFDIPTEDATVPVIRPAFPLPDAADIDIDGETQSGGWVELRGDNAAIGLSLFGNSTVNGFVFNSFSDAGLAVRGPSNRIENNRIGTDAAGAAKLGNGTGIRIGDASVGNALIGNVISGNDVGVLIAGGSESEGGNVLEKNLIGTDAAGTAPLGNRIGVKILDTPENRIGGQGGFLTSNVIAGNDSVGVEITGAASVGNIIAGNVIGAETSALAALPNGVGILLNGAGTADRASSRTEITENVISANAGHGIQISGASSENRITGNMIGDGAGKLPNGGHGIFIEEGFRNVVGSEETSQANYIVHNGRDGIYVLAGTGNAFLINSIFSNGGLGINLDEDGDASTEDGATGNDDLDADVGANDLQNAPIIGTVLENGITATGTLQSRPTTEYTLRFFSNSERPANGSLQGRTYVGSTQVTTDAGGSAAFRATLNASATFVSATATDPDGNTSEFSHTAIVVNSSGDNADASRTDAACNTGGSVTREGNAEPECTLRAAIQEANARAGDDVVLFDIPGTAPHFIVPSQALPSVTDGLTLDGASQPGYTSEQKAIQISGRDAGSVSGLTVSAEGSLIRGFLIEEFAEHGVLLAVGGVKLEDIYARRNGVAGVFARQSLTATGVLWATDNGTSAAAAGCTLTEAGGVIVEDSATLEAVRLEDNCGTGLKSLSGSVHIRGDAQVRRNRSAGIVAQNDILLDGQSHAIDANALEGLISLQGNITIRGEAAVDDNGKGRAACGGPPGLSHASGIRAEFGLVDTEKIAVIGNCGEGIYAEHVRIRDSATILRNLSFGIRSIFETILDEGEHEISDNGGLAVASFNESESEGAIRVSGRLRAKGNGFNGDKENTTQCSSSSTGAILGWGPISLTGGADISENCGSGVFSGASIHIGGHARVFGNMGRGLNAFDDVVLTGPTNTIARNREEGLVSSNGFVRIDHEADILANGLGMRDAGCEAAIGAQHVRAGRIRILGNCGTGITAASSVQISDAIGINQNTSHGVSTKSVTIATGEICGNDGYGIVAGETNLGSVEICSNDLGGVKIFESANKRDIAAAETSTIQGAQLLENAGPAIQFEGSIPLVMRRSNLIGNESPAIVNTHPTLVVDARENWWGSAADPHFDTSGPVDAANWLGGAVGLVLTPENSHVVGVPGAPGTATVYLRDWTQPASVYRITVDDSLGWLSGSEAFEMTSSDTAAVSMPIPYLIPREASTTNRVTVRAELATDANMFSATTFSISPDSTAEPVAFEATLPPATSDERIGLSPAYPNPATGSASFTLWLRDPQFVTVRVYDLLGREVAQLFDGMLAGLTSTVFNIETSGWSSGLYLYEVRGRDFREARTLFVRR